MEFVAARSGRFQGRPGGERSREGGERQGSLRAAEEAEVPQAGRCWDLMEERIHATASQMPEGRTEDV